MLVRLHPDPSVEADKQVRTPMQRPRLFHKAMIMPAACWAGDGRTMVNGEWSMVDEK